MKYFLSTVAWVSVIFTAIAVGLLPTESVYIWILFFVMLTIMLTLEMLLAICLTRPMVYTGIAAGVMIFLTIAHSFHPSFLVEGTLNSQIYALLTAFMAALLFSYTERVQKVRSWDGL